MLTVAYYTPAYANEVDRLRRSLERCGMAHEIEAAEDRGDWYRNTAHKAEFLRAMRDQHRGPLLYVDADAFVHRSVEAELSGRDCDLGVHFHQGGSKLGSGTLLLNDTANCRELLRRWCTLNRMKQQRGQWPGGGQANLAEVVRTFVDLSVWRMPARYCFIFDLSKRWNPDETPVIEHLQASRVHKGGRSPASRDARIAELETLLEGAAA